MKSLAKSVPKFAADAAVKKAYDLTLTPGAVARLVEVREAAEYAAEQAKIASGIKVTDDESNQAASDVVVNLAKTAKACKELQKFFTDPLEQAKKGIIATFKKLGEDAAGQEDRLRGEIGALFMKREQEKRAELQRQQDAEAERQRKARALGRSAPAPLPVAIVPEISRNTATENGALNVGLEWAYMGVSDINLVPRQYLMINEVAARAAVKSGTRVIPGLIIAERPKTRAI